MTDDPEVTVVIVNWNTREITLRAIETLLANAGAVRMQVIVWDNASQDGSVDAIAARFPQVELVAHDENIGFARANNAAARLARSEWLLLLNSDTETRPRAIEALLAFARAHPEAGIVGGRTYFGDGSLNPTSCWKKMTAWSLFASATGLTRAFRGSEFFNPEGMGDWPRDTVRHVDIVTGCFFLLPTALWNRLGGFDERFFMYGEEADLCLRAAALGYRPMITPDAEIVHLGGASAKVREAKQLQLMTSKATLVRTHWPRARVPVGIAMLWLWIAVRRTASALLAAVQPRHREGAAVWRTLWRRRHEWLAGHPAAADRA